MKTIGSSVLTLALALGMACPLGATDRLSDPQVTRSLEEAFHRDARLKDADILVSCSSGFVTLRGDAASFLEKHRAEQIAKRTAGVRGVTNLLQVDSLARRDEELAADVQRRLNQSSFLGASGVRANAANGVVTLSGPVESWAQSRQAERVVAEVRGVRLVRNQLTVAASGASLVRDDQQIQREVEAEFRRDAYLAELPIQVTVQDGLVRLAGQVPNLYQKDHAAEEARTVDGVRVVDNQLQVSSQFRFEWTLEPPADEELAEAVLEELRADPRVVAGDIQAVSSRRRITLTGSVATMLERQMAERMARRVFGVVSVDNQLQVFAVTRSDEEILDDLQFNLRSDSLLSDQALGVTVTDAAVTLTGEVPHFNSKVHAGRVAGRVQGVRAIQNELKVRWSEATSDDAVRQLILSRLESNATTRPVWRSIQVEVVQGAVTLNGKVGRSAQIVEAERIAKATDGVRAVNNQLLLGPGAAATPELASELPRK